jgi:hypothetical protein
MGKKWKIFHGCHRKNNLIMTLKILKLIHKSSRKDPMGDGSQAPLLENDTTANSTSIHFGMGHLCHKHNKIFILDNIEEFDVLKNCEKIRKYSNILKLQHIFE